MRRIAALGLAAAFGLATIAGCGGGPKEGVPDNPVVPPSGWKPTRGPRNVQPGEPGDKAGGKGHST
jgi:hypothetical protein